MFATATVLLFFAALEAVLWASGVRPDTSREDPYVGFSSQLPLLVEREEAGNRYMVTAPNKLRWFNEQRFPRVKPSNTYRIFTLGGSTTYGRPYDDTTSFSGWLRELLAEADPSRNWEVINAGGISYASYRVVKVMEELIQYQPDMFIVYTGHNEFLEDRTYGEVKRLPSIVRNTGALLGHSRTYSAVRRLLKERPPQTTSTEQDHASGELSAEVQTRLDRGVGPDAYERDAAWNRDVLQHFRYNLQRMIEVARSAGAEIVFVTPASNLANCSPFKSQHDPLDDAEQEARWQKTIEAAEDAFAQGDQQAALKGVDEALQLDGHDARSLYLRGRVLMSLGRYDEAKAALIQARDEDVCPLRALTPIVQFVRDVAAEQQAPLIDFEKIVDQASEHQVPGESLFLDHVHPTIDGNRLLGLALLDQLTSAGIVSPNPAWNAQAIDRVAQRIEQRLTPQTRSAALRNLAKVLTWAGKTEEANRLALQADQLSGGDGETAYLAGNALLESGQVQAAINKLQEALRLEPNHGLAHNSLGTAYLKIGRTDEAVREFETALALLPQLAAAHNNLGVLYQNRKQFDQAINHFRQAVTINPRYASASNNLGVLFRQQGKLDEAEASFRKALEINPDSAEAHFNLGTIQASRGNGNDAMAEFQRALRLNPKYAPARYYLGMELEKRGQTRAALDAYRQCVQLPSPPLDAGRRLAWLLATSSDDSIRNGAVAVSVAEGCAKAVKYSNPEVLSTLAAAYAEAGQFDQAVRWQTEALQKVAPAERSLYEARLEQLRRREPLRSGG